MSTFPGYAKSVIPILTLTMHRSVYLTEFADNGSLDKHIQQHKEQPNFEQSLKWAKQVAQGTYAEAYVGTYIGTATSNKVTGRREQSSLPLVITVLVFNFSP